MFPFSKPKLPVEEFEDKSSLMSILPSVTPKQQPPSGSRQPRASPITMSPRRPEQSSSQRRSFGNPAVPNLETEVTARPRTDTGAISFRSPSRSTRKPGSGMPVGRKPQLTHRLQGGSDVSFLQDRPGHGIPTKKGQWSDVKVPSTHIPAGMEIVETSFLPPNDPNYESWYDGESSVWKTRVFPALKPVGRKDVQLLEEWLTQQLAERARQDWEQQQATMHAQSSFSSESGAVFDGEDEDGLWISMNGPARVPQRSPQLVRDQMGLLMLGFHEVVRQVTMHCVERGQLLERIWGALNDLFEYVIEEMQETIADCEGRLEAMHARMKKQTESTEGQRRRMQEEVAETTHTLTRRWGKKMQMLKDKMFEQEKELKRSQKTLRFLRDWLPNFDVYSDTALTQLLPGVGTSRLDGVKSPEAAFRSDMQRLLDSDVATIAGMRNAVSAPPLGRLSSTHSTESLAAELSRDQHDPVLPPETVIQVMARDLTKPEGGAKEVHEGSESDHELVVQRLFQANQDVRAELAELRLEFARAEGRTREQQALRSQDATLFQSQIHALESLAISVLEGPDLNSQSFDVSNVLSLRTYQMPDEVGPVQWVQQELWRAANGYLALKQTTRPSIFAEVTRGNQPAAVLLSRKSFAAFMYEDSLQKAQGMRVKAEQQLRRLLMSLKLHYGQDFKTQSRVDESQRLQLKHYLYVLGLDEEEAYSMSEKELFMSLLSVLKPYICSRNRNEPEENEDRMFLLLLPEADALSAAMSVLGTTSVVQGGKQRAVFLGLHAQAQPRRNQARMATAQPCLEHPWHIMDPEIMEEIISSIKEGSKAYNGLIELHAVIDICIQSWKRYHAKLSNTLSLVCELVCKNSEQSNDSSLGHFSILMHLISPGMPLHILNCLYAEVITQSSEGKIEPEIFAEVLMNYPVACNGLNSLFAIDAEDAASTKTLEETAELAIQEANKILAEIDHERKNYVSPSISWDMENLLRIRSNQLSLITRHLSAQGGFIKLWVISHILMLESDLIRKHGSVQLAFDTRRSNVHCNNTLKRKIFSGWRKALHEPQDDDEILNHL